MPINGSIIAGPNLGFGDCGIDAGTGAGGGSGQVRSQARREVAISGKRVKTVDVHAH